MLRADPAAGGGRGDRGEQPEKSHHHHTMPGGKLRLLRSRPEPSAGMELGARQDLSVWCTVRCLKITPLTAGSCRAGLIRKLFEAPV